MTRIAGCLLRVPWEGTEAPYSSLMIHPRFAGYTHRRAERRVGEAIIADGRLKWKTIHSRLVHSRLASWGEAEKTLIDENLIIFDLGHMTSGAAADRSINRDQFNQSTSLPNYSRYRLVVFHSPSCNLGGGCMYRPSSGVPWLGWACSCTATLRPTRPNLRSRAPSRCRAMAIV